MSDQTAEQTAEEEAYRRQLRDPAVRKRLQEIYDEARSGSEDPGVTAEQLPGFLRDHGV